MSTAARMRDAVPTGSADVAMTDESRRAKIDAIRKLQQELGLTNSRMGQTIGKSASVITHVMKNEYAANPDPILQALHQKLHQLKKVQESPGHGAFVETEVARKVFTIAEHVLTLGTIGSIVGPAGCGKTMSLRAIAANWPDSIYLEVMGCWTASALAEALADAINVPISGFRSTSITVKRVVARIKGAHRLIILDEAHLMKRETMTLARQIHDATGCPMIWSGVPGLIDRLLDGRGDRMQGATLYSRIGLKYDLTEECQRKGGKPLYSVQDVRSFFDSLSLRLHRGDEGRSAALDPQALFWLHGMACLPADGSDEGGLRACKNIVRLAFAAHMHRRDFTGTLTLEMLVEACQALLGTGATRDLVNRIEIRKAAG